MRQRPLPRLSSCRKILVVKFDFIGDWVLCLPFLETLRRNAPKARITAAVLEPVFALAAACLYVDRAIAIPPSNDGMARGRSALEAEGFLRDYEFGTFDLALVPRWDADFNGASRFAYKSGASAVVGFSERCTRRKQRYNNGWDRFYTHVVDDWVSEHEAVQNLKLLELFGRRATAGTACLHTTEIDERAAEMFLRSAPFDAIRPVLALAPFASEAKRTLPLICIAQLGRWLLARFPVNIAIIGSPTDAPKAEQLAKAIGRRAASACRRMSLRGSAALMRRCAAVIGMDSGPAHIAAALERPVAVLSCHPASGAPHHENAPERFAPWGDPSRILILQPERAEPPCEEACRAGASHCILRIPEQKLLQALDGFVGRALGSSDA